MGYSKRPIREEERQRALAQAKIDLCDVFMLFEKQELTWRASFTKPLGQGQLPRVCHFADPGKIRNLYERFGTQRSSEEREAFANALIRGRGAAMLSLGREQYNKLLRRG